MQVEEESAVIYSDEDVEIHQLEGRSLELRHKSRFKLREGFLRPEFLTLWSHEMGSVLAKEHILDSVVLTGSPDPLLSRGVVDYRHRWAGMVQLFNEHIQGTSTVIPFFTADDPFDLREALNAVIAHFYRRQNDGGFTAKVWSSHIPSDHPDKYRFYGKGWIDVLNGFWAGNRLSRYKSEEAFKDYYRKHLMDDLQIKCLVLEDIENIEVCDSGISSNFVPAVDDAIDLLKGWGMQCAVAGSKEAWWTLKGARNGPSKHAFKHLHIPADKALTPSFMRTMQLMYCSNVELNQDVLKRVYEMSGGVKNRALTLISHLAGFSYVNDYYTIEVKDIEKIFQENEQLAPRDRP